MSVITVKAATTSNIASFPPSGTQTIDGVSVSTNGDLVLVKDQTTASQNGVWQKNAGTWTRPTLADSGPELLDVAVLVSEGTTQAGTLWQCAIGTITVGTTALAFAEIPYNRPAVVSVRAATERPLSNPPSGLISIDGITLASGDLVLVRDQADSTQNGIYTALAGTWTRPNNLNSDLELAGITVGVREGENHAQTIWSLGKVPPFTVGSEPLLFQQVPPVMYAPLVHAVVATTANVPSLSGLLTIDNYQLVAGDRVLVKNQTVGSQNGLYVCAASAWARDRAADTFLKMLDLLVFVLGEPRPAASAPTQRRQMWKCTTAAPFTVGTTSLSFADVSVGPSFPGLQRTLERTLPATGVPIGTRAIVVRSLGDVARGRVINGGPAGGTVFWLNRPGSVVARFDGSDWAPESSTVENADSTLTPYDFGGVGDGVNDDTAALQAWLDALGRAQQQTTGHLPLGRWRHTAPLSISGGGDNFHGITILGRNGKANGANGSVLFFDGDVVDYQLRMTGVVGSYFADIILQSNYKAAIPLLVDTATGIDESSSNITFERCSVFFPRDVAGAACMSVGAASGAVYYQTDTVRLVECNLIAKEGLVPCIYADCFKTGHASNTKNFELHRVQVAGGRRGVNWELASGYMHLIDFAADGCSVDVYQGNGGVLVVDSAESERSGGMLKQTGTFGYAKITGWEHHAGRLCIDDTVITATGRVSVNGCQSINYRAQRTITLVNTTTDQVSFLEDENEVALNALEPVQIRSLGSLPAPLVAGVTYYVAADVAEFPLGSGTWRCSLAANADGTGLIDLTTVGSGAISFVSPPKIVCSSMQMSGGMSSFESRQNYWDCAIDHLPIYEGPYDLLGAVYAAVAAANGIPTAITSIDDVGGQIGAVARLRNLAPAVSVPYLQLERTTPRGTVLFSGAPGTAWHVQDFNYTDFVGSGGLDTTYIRMPARGRVLQCKIEILVPFAYSGSTVTAFITDAANPFTSTILGRPAPAATCDLKAAAGTVYGDNDAHLGTGLGNGITLLTDSTGGTANNAIAAIPNPADAPASADALRDDLVANTLPEIRNGLADLAAKVNAILGLRTAGGYRPAAATWDTPWLLQVDIATAPGAVGNGTVTNMTAGKFRLSIEYSVPPRG